MSTTTNKKNESIFGVGTDIIEIDRFKHAHNKYGDRFLTRIFSKREIAHCNKYKDPERRFAARFAAKEAVVKALGEGFGKHISFQDIEILNHANGKPYIVLSEKCDEHFDSPNLLLSISHSHYYATAVVIATHGV